MINQIEARNLDMIMSYKKGIKQKELAVRYGITNRRVSQIIQKIIGRTEMKRIRHDKSLEISKRYGGYRYMNKIKS